MRRRLSVLVIVVASSIAGLSAIPAAASASADPASTAITTVNGPFGPGIAPTPAQTAAPGGPNNPLGLPAYYVYQGGAQLSPNASDFPLSKTSTDSTASPAARTTCTNTPHNDPQGNAFVDIYAHIDCSNPALGNHVTNPVLTLWQRSNPNGSGGWQNAATRRPNDGTTPYQTGGFEVRCNRGWQMHTQFTANVATPNGAGPENNNSNNETCK